jgi:hypothetical protein
MAKNGSLTPRQLKTIEAMLTAESINEAAEQSGVGQRTLYRWLAEDDQFKAQLRKAQDRAIDAAVSLLSGEARAAAMTLREIHRDKEINAAVRVQAARAILIENMRVREQRDVLERLELLEAKIYASGH